MVREISFFSFRNAFMKSEGPNFKRRSSGWKKVSEYDGQQNNQQMRVRTCSFPCKVDSYKFKLNFLPPPLLCNLIKCLEISYQFKGKHSMSPPWLILRLYENVFNVNWADFLENCRWPIYLAVVDILCVIVIRSSVHLTKFFIFLGLVWPN